LPAIDEKRRQQIRVFCGVDLPFRLGERDQGRNVTVPESDSFCNLQCKSGGKHRTLGRQSADELERGRSGLLSRRRDGLKVPPQTGSCSLAPALDKGFQKRIELLGEDCRSESLLASEVVIERAFRDANGRGYVPNADARVSELLKQHSC
jgi:hypothetical protein